MTFHHTYYADSRQSQVDAHITKLNFEKIMGAYRSSQITKGEAERLLRSAGAFELEINEFLKI